MTIVLGAVLMAALVWDMRRQRPVPALRLPGTGNASGISLAVAICGFGGTLYTAGLDTLMDADKWRVLEALDRSYVMWTVGAVLAAVFGFARGQWTIVWCAMLLIVCDLLIGFRTSAAISTGAITVIWLHRVGPQRLLLRHPWLPGAVLAGGALMLAYKLIYAAVKLGDWELVAEQLRNPTALAGAVMYSEPFLTQSVLNEIVLQNFRVGWEHFVPVLYQMLPLTLGIAEDAVTFNDLFQPVLFPQVTASGLAANIWAEMLATGGLPLLCAFVLAFVCLLAAGSFLLRLPNLELQALTAVSMVYFAFYIHRNDLLYQVVLEKRVLLLGGAAILGSMAIREIAMRLASPRYGRSED
jgi:hypothetical protein